jgi:uncharacterized protein (TIGR00730 family)
VDLPKRLHSIEFLSLFDLTDENFSWHYWAMRIAVFCSASTKIDDKYVDFAFEVGKAIAEHGWDVAWGGGTLSMMGSVSRGARSVGGKTFGVIPHKLVGKEFADEEATELFITESMRSRKAMLEDLSNGFLILPGGLGTMEEFMEIWVARHLGYHNKPIVVCDPFGFYDTLHTFLHSLKNEKFINDAHDELVTWVSDIPSAISAFKLSIKPANLI